MFGLNYVVAQFLAWYHNVDGILGQFEKTKQRLAKAADHHIRLANQHIDTASRHTVIASVHNDDATRATSVADKIDKLIN